MRKSGSIKRGMLRFFNTGGATRVATLVVLLFGLMMLSGCSMDSLKGTGKEASIDVKSNQTEDVVLASTEEVELIDYFEGGGSGSGSGGAANASHNITLISDNINNYCKLFYQINGSGWVDASSASATSPVSFSVAEGSDVSFRIEIDYTLNDLNDARTFLGWYDVNRGERYSVGPTYTINKIKSDIHLSAKFDNPTSRRHLFKVITTSSPLEGGITTGGYMSDTAIQSQISASPNPGYEFAYWSVKSIYKTKDKEAVRADYILDGASSVIMLSKRDYTDDKSDVNEATAICTAVFYKMQCNVSVASISSDKAAQVSANGYAITESAKSFDGFSDVDIEIIPMPGYKFESCSYTTKDGITHTEKNRKFKIKEIKEDIFLNVVMTGDVKINAIADPSDGGTTDIATVNENEVEIESFGSTAELKKGTNIVLKATPKDGYVFDHWKSPQGTWLDGIDNPGATSADPHVNKLFIKNVQQDDTYYAIFVPSLIKVTTEVNPYDASDTSKLGGWVTFNGGSQQSESKEYTIASNEPFILQAIPNSKDGYVFDKWQDNIGNTYQGEKIRINELIENRTYTAMFSKAKNVIKVVSSPAEAGNPTVNDSPGSLEIEQGGQAVLKANPASGYKFYKWVNLQGDIYEDEEITIPKVDFGDTYTAYYVKDGQEFTIGVMPENAGKVKLDNNSFVTSDTSYHVEAGSDITLTAEANSGYKFDRWQDEDGKTYTTNPLYLSKVTGMETYRAVFSATRYTITTVASPVDGGTPKVNGKTGEVEVDAESKVTLTANPNEGFTFEKWTNQQGDTFTDEELIIETVTNSDVYVAHYLSGSVDFTIDLSPEGSGRVKLDGNDFVEKRTSYDVAAGSNVTVTAEPYNDYTFERWQDSEGNVYNVNPLSLVNIKGNEVITAIFNKKSKGLRVIADPASGGHVTKDIDGSGKAVINAVPNRGWKFVGWYVDDKFISSKKKCSVKDDGSDITYVGKFGKSKDFDARTDISDIDFYNAKRLYERPNYSVTRQTMLAQAVATIASEGGQYKDATPGLKDYKAFVSLREYYNNAYETSIVKLIEGKLTTTEGELFEAYEFSDFENIMPVIRDIVDEKYGAGYDANIIAAVNTVAPSGFDGSVRTYLWKETDAGQDDNLFVLYKDTSGIYSQVAAVVDEENTVIFTIDDAVVGSDFALVKVIIPDSMSELGIE